MDCAGARRTADAPGARMGWHVLPGRLLIEHPKWSPDGRAVLFTTGGTRIYVLEITDGHVRFLAYGQDAEWSPDGRLVAFTCLGRGWEIGIIRGDGTGGASYAAVPAGIRSRLVWDPVGGSILFADGAGRITALQVQDGTLTPLELPAPCDELSWSPDGEWLAFTAPRPEGDGLGLYLFHRRDRRLTGIGTVPPGHLFWTLKGRTLIALSLDGGWGSIRYDVATCTARPLRVPEGLTPLAPSPAGDDILYLADRAPGDLTVGETGGNRLRVFAHGYLPAWSPDGEWVAFFDSPDVEGSLCTQSRNGANFTRWAGSSPGAPVREQIGNLAAWSAVFVLFPGLPAAAATLATLPFIARGSWHAIGLLAAWIALFFAYRPALRWAMRIGHTFDCPRFGHALATLPAALLAALSMHHAFALALFWIAPLIAVWVAICVFGAIAVTGRGPGSYRALAAAWAAALAATFVAGAIHGQRRSAERPAARGSGQVVQAAGEHRW